MSLNIGPFSVHIYFFFIFVYVLFIVTMNFPFYIFLNCNHRYPCFWCGYLFPPQFSFSVGFIISFIRIVSFLFLLLLFNSLVCSFISHFL